MFNRKDTAVAEPVTGTEILRRTIRNRNRTPTALSILASDLGIGIASLQKFAEGGDLSDAVKSKLAALLFQTGGYDSERDILFSRGPSSQPLGLIPEPCAPMPVGSGYPPVPDPKARSGFSPGPAPGKPFSKRPGWA